MKSHRRLFLLVAGVLAVGALALAFFLQPRPPAAPSFDGQRALQDVEAQMAFGDRTPGAPGHRQTGDWIAAQWSAAGWQVSVQELDAGGVPVRNIIARRGSGRPWVVLGAHYDTRRLADQSAEPEQRLLPVPGANDGASGIAVLTELARSIPADLPFEIWLVAFDAEDQGNLDGAQWIVGSTAFVNELSGQPDAAVIVDMIGDADLNIYQERNSTPELVQAIWEQARLLGYAETFIPQPRFSMLDDHTPFLQKGIPAVDLIDFDYPYWHTVEDTTDKISARSLDSVGDTVLAWLLSLE